MSFDFLVTSLIIVASPGTGVLYTLAAGLSRASKASVVAAFGLGAINKLLEPFAGAVLGKIILLAFVVLFIQRRPQGLYALKGRSAES